MSPVEIITEAARSLETVLITYTNRKGYTKSYITEPYELKFDKYQRLIYWGWNVAEGHIAQFVVARIAHAELTGQPFFPRMSVKI